MIKRMLLILVVTLAVLGALFGARIGQIMYAKEHHYVPPPPTVATSASVAGSMPSASCIGQSVMRALYSTAEGLSLTRRRTRSVWWALGDSNPGPTD